MDGLFTLLILGFIAFAVIGSAKQKNKSKTVSAPAKPATGVSARAAGPRDARQLSERHRALQAQLVQPGGGRLWPWLLIVGLALATAAAISLS